jgi:hypothetical protein
MQLVRKCLERARQMLAAMAQQAKTREQMTKAQKSEVLKDQMGATKKL